jgi:hypothetical protein
MTTAFMYDTQIEELPSFWTDEQIEQFLMEGAEEFSEDEDYFYQYEDDQALEEFSLACAFGEEY